MVSSRRCSISEASPTIWHSRHCLVTASPSPGRRSRSTGREVGLDRDDMVRSGPAIRPTDALVAGLGTRPVLVGVTELAGIRPRLGNAGSGRRLADLDGLSRTCSVLSVWPASPAVGPQPDSLPSWKGPFPGTARYPPPRRGRRARNSGRSCRKHSHQGLRTSGRSTLVDLQLLAVLNEGMDDVGVVGMAKGPSGPRGADQVFRMMEGPPWPVWSWALVISLDKGTLRLASVRRRSRKSVAFGRCRTSFATSALARSRD